MSAVTITLTDICSGQNHLTFTLTGAVSVTRTLDINDLQAALTAEDADTLIKLVARAVRQGRTLAQTRTLLQTGVTVGS